jgi:hypothetical protein
MALTRSKHYIYAKYFVKNLILINTDKINIESKSDNRKWFVEVNRWFDLKEDDGKIERELTLIEQPNVVKKINYDGKYDEFDYREREKNRFNKPNINGNFLI